MEDILYNLTKSRYSKKGLSGLNKTNEELYVQ